MCRRNFVKKISWVMWVGCKSSPWRQQQQQQLKFPTIASADNINDDDDN